jgi:hypothetical protein
MSLTELILRHPARAEVRACLDRFIPAFRGSTPSPLLVPRSSSRPALVGVAFDYAARMELAHRAPTARTGPWIAELAVPLLRRRRRAAAERVIGAARRATRRWPHDERVRLDKIAFHAASLAPLDAVYRVGLPPFDDVPPEVDVQSIAAEVRALLEAASPLWSLADISPLHLNPEVCGNLVGGADADIIAGSTIIEIKTTKDPIVERDHLRQLVGYACLAAVAPESVFPRIERLAVFFPRFGQLRTFELEASDEDRVEAAFFLAETWRGPQSYPASATAA